MSPRPWTLDRVQGVAINDPFVMAVPVEPSHEPMVDLRTTGLRLDDLHADEEGLFAFTRRTVAARLVEAEGALPDGVHLLLVEGYRPPALQERYFAEHLDGLRRTQPDLPEHLLRVQASLHVAPPEVAPHTAGGAIDLTLCDGDGQALDMGTEINATPEKSGNRCFTVHPHVDGEARQHRDLLRRVMAAAGFVNFGPEWWHWSYGDRYWALRVGAPAAFYDTVSTDTVLGA